MPKGGVQTNITYSWGASTNPSAWGPFSPGTPLTPVVQEPVRSYDFKPNINATLRPRAYEQFGFPALRAFANVEMVRLAIETRKDQFERLDWQIKPTDNKKKVADDPRIAEMRKFWRKPDGVTPFATFLRLSLEDLLVLDAPAFELRRTLGGKLLGLEIVPGDTIHPMVDNTGRRPRGVSDVAYQQVIKGVAWADLTNTDLLYVPRNPRPNHLYGFGPVEQIIVTINTILRRQASQLAYFTEGNVPAGLLNAPENWDQRKIQELQQWFDDRIAGNQAEQNKLIWGPAGSKYTAFKDSPIKDEFDEWLARIVAFAFSLPPTPFIRQMNRSTGETDQERAQEEGLEPLKLWAKRWIDDIIQGEFGYDDLEFAWTKEDATSAKEQSEIDNTDLRNGSKTIDEVRDARGDDPLPDGLGAKPMIYTAAGAVTLESVLEPPEPPEPAVPAVDAQGAVDPTKPDGGAPTPPKPPVPGAEKLAKADLITADRPRARRSRVSLAKGLTSILRDQGDATAADVAKKLATIGKAEEDPKVSAARIADAIAAGLSFDEMMAISQLLEEELGDFATDSAKLALDALGIGADEGLTNRVFARAVAWVRARGAELVSVDGDESLIETTRNMIRSIIADGLEQNIGTDKIADAIQESSAFSADRAQTIARYEVAKANGEGKRAGWLEAQADGLELKHGWQTSSDGADTCDICLANEAQGEIPLDQPFSSGDESEPAHPRCLPGDSLVLAEGVTAASKRWYDGDLVVIFTANGKRLASTPNHPILTSHGWVASGLLNVGDDVVCGLVGDWEPSAIGSNHENVPARIEDIAEAFGRSEQVVAMPMPTAPEHFHGDGKGSEVAIIWADRLLVDRAQASGAEHSGKPPLAVADVEAALHDRSGMLDFGFHRNDSSASRAVGGQGNRLALLGTHTGVPEANGLLDASPSNVALAKNARDGQPIDTVPLGKSEFRFAGDIGITDSSAVEIVPPPNTPRDTAAFEFAVESGRVAPQPFGYDIPTFAFDVGLDRIVNVAKLHFSGHVFNLQTERGFYLASGIVTHNCQCVTYATATDPTES